MQSPKTHAFRNRLFNLIQSIPVQCLGLAIFFWLYHRFLAYRMREASINLGAVTFHRHFVPLYAVPQVKFSLWLLPALIVLISFLLLDTMRREPMSFIL